MDSAVNWNILFFKGVSSNHRIILTKIDLSLYRTKKTQTVEISQYDWSSLTNSDIKNHHRVTVRNKETSKRHTLNDVH